MIDSATARMNDAAASLEPADRALLNLWLNRGLDDAAVARMTGMGVETVANRRSRIVEHLSDLLGLPPDDVRRALTETTPAAGVSPPADVSPAAKVGPAVVVGLPTANGTATAPVDTGTGSTSRRRRRPWAAFALLGIVVAAVLLITLGSNGSGRQRRPVPRSAGAPLVALPGSSVHGTGTVTVTETSPDLRLNLSISNLPKMSGAHYEVWLYDSVVNSEDVGRLRDGVTHMSLRLPKGARRYRWIDISIQPTGQVFHSGESVLRSANPLFASLR
jgi:Anti-sigma-K factor rskA